MGRDRQEPVRTGISAAPDLRAGVVTVQDRDAGVGEMLGSMLWTIGLCAGDQRPREYCGGRRRSQRPPRSWAGYRRSERQESRPIVDNRRIDDEHHALVVVALAWWS